MRRKRSSTHPAAREPRPARRFEVEKPGKLADVARCPDCGASYRGGRWTRQAAPADAYEHVCPACERIRTDYPAGVLRLAGGFVASHRAEIEQLLRNTTERESGEHPLKRIMDLEEDEGELVVRVTDGKLAQSLGRALRNAYEGELELPPTTAETEDLVRVRWSRD